MRALRLLGLTLLTAVTAALGAAPPTSATPTPKPTPKPTPVLVEGFWYDVGGLRVRGIVCRPDLRSGRPQLNLVHGGLDSPIDKIACRRFARLGYVVAASGLRGQAGSAGKPEVCGRETEDVLTLDRLVRERFRTDGTRVAYLGVSLGGCIALKAAARAANARAVVTLLSPTDFAEQMRLLRATRPDAVGRWEALLGGSPERVPAAYAARRPLDAARDLNAPLLTVAAGNDPLIPLGQSCAVRDTRREAGYAVTEVRLTKDGQPSATPDRPWRRCEGEQPLGALPEMRLRDVLLIYTDLGHTSTPHMWNAAEAYLLANITPPNLLERFSRSGWSR